MLSYIVLKSFCFDVDRRHGETDLGYLFLSLLALGRGRILSTTRSCLIFYCCEKENFLSLSEQKKTLQTKALNHYFFLQVKEVFEESPFLVPENSVSIMDGSYEGTF